MNVLMQSLASLVQYIYEEPSLREQLPAELRAAIGDLNARLAAYMEEQS